MKNCFILNCQRPGKKEVVDRAIFADTMQLPFEGGHFCVPTGYHQWLTSIYGDYMQLPPADEQFTHHDFKAYWKE